MLHHEEDENAGREWASLACRTDAVENVGKAFAKFLSDF